MLIVGTIAVALLILAYWAFVLWLGARADRKYLEREQLGRVFGDTRNG